MSLAGSLRKQINTIMLLKTKLKFTLIQTEHDNYNTLNIHFFFSGKPPPGDWRPPLKIFIFFYLLGALFYELVIFDFFRNYFH